MEEWISQSRPRGQCGSLTTLPVPVQCHCHRRDAVTVKGVSAFLIALQTQLRARFPRVWSVEMSFFQKSLVDLVRGIRNAGNDSSVYTAKAIQEIKEELKNRDVTVKAQALQKLIYVSGKAPLPQLPAPRPPLLCALPLPLPPSPLPSSRCWAMT